MLGVGIDIVNVKRMGRILNSNGSPFLSKVFTKSEILNSKRFKNKAEYFSKLFAFKESFVKAKGCGFTSSSRPNSIEIHLHNRSKLGISFPEEIEAYFKSRKINVIDVEYFKIENNIICKLIVDLEYDCNYEKV